MEPHKISKKLLNRLSLYLDHLKSLPEDCDNISATAIAKALELGDVQVRKDLAKVSDGGRRRTGHRRQRLIADIENYLSSASGTNTIIVGAGNLGQALLDYGGFANSGLDVMAGFDIHSATKRTKAGKPIYPISKLESFCNRYDVRIGIIAVPADSAQAACDRLVDCGVEAIWNFAPVQLTTPQNIVVHSENLAVSLTALQVQLSSRERKTS